MAQIASLHSRSAPGGCRLTLILMGDEVIRHHLVVGLWEARKAEEACARRTFPGEYGALRSPAFFILVTVRVFFILP